MPRKPEALSWSIYNPNYISNIHMLAIMALPAPLRKVNVDLQNARLSFSVPSKEECSSFWELINKGEPTVKTGLVLFRPFCDTTDLICLPDHFVEKAKRFYNKTIQPSKTCHTFVDIVKTNKTAS